MGIPGAFTEDVTEQLCDMISCGCSVMEALEALEIERSSFYRKCMRDEVFKARIDKARAIQQEGEVDYTIKLADEATPDNWQVKRLQIWARQWRAGVLAPKRFGKQGDTNVNIQNNTLITNELTEADQRIDNAKQIAFALFSAQKRIEEEQNKVVTIEGKANDE